MDNCPTKVSVVQLEELGESIFSVCITFAPGQSRKEKARFWVELNKERIKYCLCAKIGGRVLIVDDRAASRGAYSEGELRKRAETYADVVRKNLINYL